MRCAIAQMRRLVGALAVVHHPPYFGYIHLHSCKHKTVTLKLTLTLTLTDTGGAVLYRLGSGLRNTAGGELQQERRLVKCALQ